MTVLVTGATGFVGHAIVHELRAQGRDVRALVRDPSRAPRLASWGVELAAGDVTDADERRRRDRAAARTSSTSSRSSAAATPTSSG